MGLEQLLEKLENLHQLSLDQYALADQLLQRLLQIPSACQQLALIPIDDNLHLQTLDEQLPVSKTFIQNDQGIWRTQVSFISLTSALATHFYCNEKGQIFKERHDFHPTTSTSENHYHHSLWEMLQDNLS